MSRKDPDFIDMVDRSVRVLQAFSAEHPVLSATQVAEIVEISRPSARRILLTFERLKYVQLEHGVYRLTPRVLRIGFSYLSSLSLWDRAEPLMRELVADINEACSIATLDEDEIVYVVRVPSKRSMSITLTIGSRLPAYPTSLGRVLLAGLPPEELENYLANLTMEPLTSRTITDKSKLREIIEQTRSKGYAIVNGEREDGVRSAAAPLYARDGRVIAAVNVSVNAARLSRATMEKEIVTKLLETARLISREIIGVS